MQKITRTIMPWALTNLCATDGVFAQVDPWRLAILQTACWDIREQILQTFFFAVDLDSRDTYRKTCASFLPTLTDELEEPGDGTGRNAKALRRAVFANHGVRLAWWGGESKLLILAVYWERSTQWCIQSSGISKEPFLLMISLITRWLKLIYQWYMW